MEAVVMTLKPAPMLSVVDLDSDAASETTYVHLEPSCLSYATLKPQCGSGEMRAKKDKSRTSESGGQLDYTVISCVRC